MTEKIIMLVVGGLCAWTLNTVHNLDKEVAVLQIQVEGINPVLDDIYREVSK